MKLNSGEITEYKFILINFLSDYHIYLDVIPKRILKIFRLISRDYSWGLTVPIIECQIFGYNVI